MVTEPVDCRRAVMIRKSLVPPDFGMFALTLVELSFAAVQPVPQLGEYAPAAKALAVTRPEALKFPPPAPV